MTGEAALHKAVGVRGRGTYVRRAMNLLVILSAILSALTGTGLGARGAERSTVVAERVVGAVAASRQRPRVTRPAAANALVDMLGRWVRIALVPRAATPLYLARLRQ